MATMWEARELERRTAARVAAAGFAPALNVIHADTQSEFDVYAFLPQQAGFRRLMVQCSLGPPSSEKLSALKANADSFGADYALYVTAGVPHQTQMNLAEVHGVKLLSESAASDLATADVAGATIDAQRPLSLREEFIVRFLRCLARLRRLALDYRDASPACKKLVGVWNSLDQVSLIHDPFERLATLYEIHFGAPKLAEECALAEGLGPTGMRALKQAYAYNRGTYTQTALAVQTLNRVHTLIAFCECACLLAQGAALPSLLADERGRRGPLAQWLSGLPAPHRLAIVAFEFVYGWGGLWRAMAATVRDRIAEAVGITPEEVDDMRGYVDHLFRDEGMGSFIKQVRYLEAEWESLALLPYFSKGIGVRRLEMETGVQLVGDPWSRWKKARIELGTECEQYERGH